MNLQTIKGQPPSILGLAGHRSMDISSVPVAFAAGINYFFFYNLSFNSLLDGLKPILTAQREELLLATGSIERDVGGLRRYLEQVRQRLDLDMIDIFFVEYVSPSDDMAQIRLLLDELHGWKEKGVIRHVGATSHNRSLCLNLIESGQCEVLMHRYNMAHRKAEEKVFPVAQNSGVPVVAFTCTRWGTLLQEHPNWQAEPPQAADCYRYALQHPAVHVALTAPKTRAELEENLSVLRGFEVTDQEKEYWEKYGDLIYGHGQDAFDREWP